jgi:hypothetical protein
MLGGSWASAAVRLATALHKTTATAASIVSFTLHLQETIRIVLRFPHGNYKQEQGTGR